MKWLKESRNCGWAVSLCLLTVFTSTPPTEKRTEGKEENSLKNRSFRFVSRSDFVRKGDIFEITRLILARNRLFPRGEKEGARPTSL